MNNQPSLLRVLGAIIYDWIFCIAIIFVFTGIIVTMNKGLAVSYQQKPAISILLCFIIFAYFFLFWRKGGQTPGMKVWKIKLLSKTSPASQSKLILRFLVVTVSLGISIFSRVFNSQGLGWHDRISGTFLVKTKQ